MRKALEKSDHSDSPADLEYWRQALRDGTAEKLAKEIIVCAFLDLGPDIDIDVRNGLTRILSHDIYGRLHRAIGRNHPNRGDDIIQRVHFQIFEALGQPQSADALGLREAYASRISFRIKDAIAKERRERRALSEPAVFSSPQTLSLVQDGADDGSQPPAEDDVVEGDDFAEEVQTGGPYRNIKSASEEADLLAQQIDVVRLLKAHVPDERKRHAFLLHMEQVPFKSKKPNVRTIAKAMNIDESTARKWIEEIQKTLQNALRGSHD